MQKLKNHAYCGEKAMFSLPKFSLAAFTSYPFTQNKKKHLVIGNQFFYHAKQIMPSMT